MVFFSTCDTQANSLHFSEFVCVLFYPYTIDGKRKFNLNSVCWMSLGFYKFEWIFRSEFISINFAWFFWKMGNVEPSYAVVIKDNRHGRKNFNIACPSVRKTIRTSKMKCPKVQILRKDRLSVRKIMSCVDFCMKETCSS